ncbi:hypothetical protein Nepgr_021018 [Nepenthes gracilis]|uniref:Uncharacterized protein n=1 Tax=Nepenthes gracilis TaxID=150966 RepID=A0AAD3SY56_NEPGR|nr:hypothetical protein Nepgr_021018 [Nepenthes gracilis]
MLAIWADVDVCTLACSLLSKSEFLVLLPNSRFSPLLAWTMRSFWARRLPRLQARFWRDSYVVAGRAGSLTNSRYGFLLTGRSSSFGLFGSCSRMLPVLLSAAPFLARQIGPTWTLLARQIFMQDAVLPSKIFLSKHSASEAEVVVEVEVESSDKSKRFWPSSGMSPRMGATPIVCPQTSSCSAGESSVIDCPGNPPAPLLSDCLSVKDHVEKKLVSLCTQVAAQFVDEVPEEAHAPRPPPTDAVSLISGNGGPVDGEGPSPPGALVDHQRAVTLHDWHRVSDAEVSSGEGLLGAGDAPLSIRPPASGVRLDALGSTTAPLSPLYLLWIV